MPTTGRVPAVRIRRLTAAHRDTARRMFEVMSNAFGEKSAPLSDRYLDRLLGDESFWALAALIGDEVAGGITAHELPMTQAALTELFIYDIAVAPPHQRRGIGRRLVSTLRELAARAGIRTVFVAADNADAHALDFYRALHGAPSPVTLFTFRTR